MLNNAHELVKPHQMRMALFRNRTLIYCGTSGPTLILSVVSPNTCLTLSGLNLSLSSSSTTSRLVVDEDDLKWFKNYRKLPCIGKSVGWKFFALKPFAVGKLSLFSGM